MKFCYHCGEVMDVPKITIPANVGDPYYFCSDDCLVSAIEMEDMPDAGEMEGASA